MRPSATVRPLIQPHLFCFMNSCVMVETSENATALGDPTSDQEDESEAKRATRTNSQTSKNSSDVQEVRATKTKEWITR